MGGPALEVGPPVSGSGDPPHNGAGAVGRSFRGWGVVRAVSQTGVVGPVLWGGLPDRPTASTAGLPTQVGGQNPSG